MEDLTDAQKPQITAAGKTVEYTGDYVQACEMTLEYSEIETAIMIMESGATVMELKNVLANWPGGNPYL